MIQENINNDEIQSNKNNNIHSKASAISYENKIIGETVIKIEITESEIKDNLGEFIIILDSSESMGNYVNEIKNKVIPKVLEKCNFGDDDFCHLITFSNEHKYLRLKKSKFEKTEIPVKGDTQMSGVLKELKKILDSIDEKKFINILIISDG